jgi:zinc protease
MVASERGVVLSERSTGLENSNMRMLNEEVNGVAFRAHPYSWSVIGNESDIKAWTQETCSATSTPITRRTTRWR